MASFVIHYIMGEKLLERIEQKFLLSEDLKNSFRLGNLVVDVLGFDKPNVLGLSHEEILEVNGKYRDRKIRKKLETHFRDDDGTRYIVNSPRVDRFVSKYRELITRDYSAMGYLFHLYTDKLFFEYLYEEVITCLDKDYQPTNISLDYVYVAVNKDGKIYSKLEFWNGETNFYQDYTKLNDYLICQYGIAFSVVDLVNYAQEFFINPGIEEVNYSKIGEVLNKMQAFTLDENNGLDDELMVFDKFDIAEFIVRSVDSFYREYQDLIMALGDCKRVKKRCKR